MGSDMYMAEQSYRPGPRKVYWDKSKLVIEQDYFPDGYREVYRGSADTKEGQAILKAWGVQIPPKPNTMVKYKATFTMEVEGTQTLFLNTTQYKTAADVKAALLSAAAESYDRSPQNFKNVKVEVVP